MTQVDLLAVVERRNQRPPRGPLGPLLVGALGLALVAVVLYALAGRGIGDRELRYATLTAETQASVAEVERLAPYVTVETQARTRADGVRELAASRFPWERALNDLTRVLPADADVSSVEASEPADAGDGAQDGAPTLSLKGCLSSQGNVPELLSRLETVRGVTTVDLKSSDAEAQDDTTSCSGEAPAFDVVASFGAWKDPVAEAGG